MKLTDADRAAISATLKISEPWDASCAIEGDVVGRLFLAGKRAGREDMRERAANAAYTAETGHCLNAQDHALSGIIRGAIAKAIRALGVDDE